jgi:hypothetical protein
VSALMRQKDLKRADVEAAFQVKQVELTAHHGPLVGSATLRTFGKPTSPRGDSNKCPLCSIKGHAQDNCYKYKSARIDTIKLVNVCKANKRSGGNKRKGKANRAKVKKEEIVEKAQRAQVRLAASPSSSTDAHWIADTGATSHMTPHHLWFTSYCPHVVPICVANNAVVYSAGVGDVILTPTIASLCSCCLSCVLHVPDLQNNLFAVLHLTSHHKFCVVIEGLQLQFLQQGALCLTATVRDGTAYMDVQVAAVAEAALASRMPLTCSLWHRCLVHISKAKIEQALKHALAQGLNDNSDNPIPHICALCVHGKQHCNLFPAKVSNCSKTPFKRIHSNLHEVPCLTSSSYCYWLTFIDNCSRYAWIYLLKRKSKAFNTFKLFKAMVEKLYNAVIRFFHKDKGGEYIGHKWDAFCGEHSIQRKHTTHTTPQQNGVTERKNCTLAEIVTAMLNKAKACARTKGLQVEHSKNKKAGHASCAAAAVAGTSTGAATKRTVTKSAARARVRLAGTHNTHTDAHWIADSGATSHMSTQRCWFKTFKLHVVPIRVANNVIVYSKGIGSIVMEPLDESLNPVCLSCVPYVPALQNNLFAVLHLVTSHHFRVVIEGTVMEFLRDGVRICGTTALATLARTCLRRSSKASSHLGCTSTVTHRFSCTASRVLLGNTTPIPFLQMRPTALRTCLNASTPICTWCLLRPRLAIATG